MDELEFAQRLKRYRRERGLTQQELADRIGVSNKSVSRWESGSYPDVPTLLSLARALDVTVDALLDPGAPVPTLQKSDWQNLLRGDAGALLQLVLVLGPLWLAGACGLTVLTQLAARRLAGERGDLPVRLPDLRGHPRLARAPFAWSKAMPALCPIVLAGFWYLYRQTLLPRFWYQHQQELYLAVWTMAGVLALLPCLKRRHWGMLLPVLAMMLACLGFRGMLAYPQVYSLFSGRLMEEKAEMSTQYYLRFGQPSEELAVAALLVAAVYLLCCFLRVEWVPAEQKGRQEPEES